MTKRLSRKQLENELERYKIAKRLKVQQARDAEQRRIEAAEDLAHANRLREIRAGRLKASDVKRLVQTITKEGAITTIVLRFSGVTQMWSDERQDTIDRAIIEAIEKGTAPVDGFKLDFNRFGTGGIISPSAALTSSIGSGS